MFSFLLGAYFSPENASWSDINADLLALMERCQMSDCNRLYLPAGSLTEPDFQALLFHRANRAKISTINEKSEGRNRVLRLAAPEERPDVK